MHERHPSPSPGNRPENSPGPGAHHNHGHSGPDSSGHGVHQNHAGRVQDFRRRFWVSLVLTLPVLLLSPTIQRWTGVSVTFPGVRGLLWILSTAVYLYGGWPFLKGMVRELRGRQPGMMTLIALAITVAYGYSSVVVFGLPGKVFFWELATLIDIMLLGHWIEMRSVMGASRALETLVRLMPSEAHRLEHDGRVVDVPVSSLQPGDRVLVRPGEKVPVDGIVVQGRSSVNEALLTGESRPVEKGEGDPVITGSINGSGVLVVEVQKTGQATYLAQVIALVQQAQATRSRTQDLAARAAFWLTLLALGAGTTTLALWLVLDKSVAFALERAVTVMVITCPHALGLAVPLVVAVSTALAARRGLLIRDRSAFERARGLQVVIFDKTGTLTEGQLGVSEIVALQGTPEQVLQVAVSLEYASEHPIAQGIRRYAEERGISPMPVETFRALPGRGVEGRIQGRRYRVVSPGYLREQGLPLEAPEIRPLMNQGKTVVFVLEDQRILGALALDDRIRPESRKAVQHLKNMGLRVMMLTGDTRAVAQRVAAGLGLDDFFAEVLPHEKAERVAQVQRQGQVVAMVGDGINDAPALAQADVGIAIGAGTDVAVEAADIVLVRNDPRDVVALLALSRATYRKMLENLAWATGYNLVALPLAAGLLYPLGILLSPALGALFMSLSTVIVALNARRLALPGPSAPAGPA